MARPTCKHCDAPGVHKKGLRAPVWFCDDHLPVRQFNAKGYPITGLVSRAHGAKNAPESKPPTPPHPSDPPEVPSAEILAKKADG